MENNCRSEVTHFFVYLTLAMKVWSTRPLPGPACAAPAESPGNAAPVCPQTVEWCHTSLGKAAWQRLLLLLKKLHLLDLTLETMGYCPGMNRELGDTAEPLQFMLLLELLQIPAALMISAQLAQRKTKKANGSVVMSQTNMGLLLFHSSVSEHEEDADQQSLQGECEKRAQPSAETSVQPKRQCSGKRAWLPAWSPTKRIPAGCSSSGVSGCRKPLGGEHRAFPMESGWHPLWALKM